MATEVDDELEKYTKPPTDDELEQYAKPASDEGEKEVPEERQLPGATERLKATAKGFKAPFREEIEHPPQPENLGFTLENLANLPGRFAKGLGNVYEFGKNVASDVAGIRGPSDLGKITEKYVNKPQEEQADIASQYEEKARKEPFLSREGLLDAITGTGHRIASVTPFVGPWVAGHAENLGKTGDVPGEAAEVGGEMAGGKLAERIGAHPVESARAVGALADKIARGTPLTEAGKRQAAFQQAMGIKKPSMSETEYATRVQAAMPELQRIAKENPNIKTPREEVQAINNRVAQIEAPIAHHLEQVPDAQQMVPATTWVPGVDQAMDAAFQSKGRGHFSPEEMDKAKQAVWKFIGDQDKPAAVMEGNRRRLNDLASDYWKSKTAGKQSIDVGDATAVAQRAASDAMRDHLYGDGTNPGALEQAGITARDTSGNPVDIRSVRKTVGNLLEIRNHFEDAITKAEDTGNWKAWAKLHVGPSVAAGGLGLAAGTLAGHPLLGILAGEGIKAWGDYLRSKNPNVLTAKMNRNLRGLPESVTADVQTQMPAPPVPPVPFQHTVGAATPPPPVPQAFRMQPTGTVGSLGQLGTRGRGGVSIAGLLPERIGQEATEPPPVPTQFRTEPVGEARNQNLLGARGLGGVVAPRMAGLLPERIGQPEPEPGAPPPAVAGKFALEPTGTVEDATRLGQRGLGGILAPRVKGLLGGGLPEKIGGEGREGTLEPLKKKEPESTLGKISEEQIPYTRPLPIPASKVDVPHGVTGQSVLHHELGHAIVAGLNGLETDSIVTHRYPLMSSASAVAALRIPSSQFYDGPGLFKKDMLINGGERLVDMFAAGAAANELIDGIHRDQNPGLWGDRKAAKRLFDALDIPEDQHRKLFDAAVDRAKEKLSGNGITDLIRSEAKFREDNLPVEFHFSPRRIDRIMQEVRRLQNEPAKSDLGHETADFSGRGEGGGETVSGREGASTQEPRKTPAPWEIKPFKPPKRSYDIEIRGGGEDRTVTLEALNRKKAFEEAQKKYPEAREFHMTAERMPEVGPPFEIEPKEEEENLYTAEGAKGLAETIGAKVVGSVAKGKAKPGDLDLRIDGHYDNDAVEKHLGNIGFEHYGSQLVGPKEAKASKKAYAPGWNRAEYFEDSKGRKVEVWHDAEENEMVPFEKGEEEPGPLRGMVKDKDAEARVNRKLNRKEGIG